MIIENEILIVVGTVTAGASAAWAYALQRERLRRAAGGWVAMFDSRRALAWHETKRLLAVLLAAGGAILAIAFWWIGKDLVVDERWLMPRLALGAVVLTGVGALRIWMRRRQRAAVAR